MNRKFVLIMAGLAIVVMALFAYLGGFSSPSVTVTTSQQLYIAGQPFQGSTKDELLGNTFRRAAEVVDKKELNGVLGSIYYNNPDEDADSISAFIGVVVTDTTAALPPGYTLRTVPGGRRVVQAEVNAHYMLAPNKLYTGVFDYAKSQKLELEEFFVEWFPESRHGMVQVPIKE